MEEFLVPQINSCQELMVHARIATHHVLHVLDLQALNAVHAQVDNI